MLTRRVCILDARRVKVRKARRAAHKFRHKADTSNSSSSPHSSNGNRPLVMGFRRCIGMMRMAQRFVMTMAITAVAPKVALASEFMFARSATRLRAKVSKRVTRTCTRRFPRAKVAKGRKVVREKAAAKVQRAKARAKVSDGEAREDGLGDYLLIQHKTMKNNFGIICALV